MRLKNKVIIVTGSARALGRAFAIRYAQEGAKVVACDIADAADTVGAIECEGGEALSIQPMSPADRAPRKWQKRL